MKLNKHIQFLCVLCIFAVIILSCKKEQAAMRSLEEDCACAKEVSAEFVMEEIYAYGFNWERRTETADTTYGDKNVSFYANEDNAEYTWYIGAEVIHTREVIRYFPNSMDGQTIPITLVTKKKANLICFPNDDGYDSVTHYLTIVEDKTLIESGGAELNFEGQYKVKSPLSQDSILITIDYYWVQAGAVANMLNIVNYDGNGSDCIHGTQGAGFAIPDFNIDFNYKQIFIDQYTISVGNALHGNIKLDKNIVEMNIVTGGYVNGVYNTELYDWKYKGRKL